MSATAENRGVATVCLWHFYSQASTHSRNSASMQFPSAPITTLAWF